MLNRIKKLKTQYKEFRAEQLEIMRALAENNYFVYVMYKNGKEYAEFQGIIKLMNKRSDQFIVYDEDDINCKITFPYEQVVCMDYYNEDDIYIYVD